MQLFNTMTRKKEAFVPKVPQTVGMYVCGPTTYNYIHLGNARFLVVFDTIRKYFLYKGYQVTYIQNFTDIDDKIINRANEEGENALALAQRYIQEYFQDADALNIMRAEVHPKVSEHLPEIIAMVKTLEEKGHAYAVDGDVYYSIQSFPEYGKLSGRSLEDMQSGARVEINQKKKHPMDFVLWKAAKPGEPAWESPWGLGRPGWHIECSAMSLKYLGADFDIHGGGYDLIFPHHENEIAQSEAATGQNFARYWMHNGFITVNQEKMSKSLGNFFIVRDILAKFSPEAVRFFLLSTHYRSPLDFDDQKLEEATKALTRIKNSLRAVQEALQDNLSDNLEAADQSLLDRLAEFKADFEKAMDDDFNTALATGVWFEMVGAVNAYLGQGGHNRQVITEAWSIFEIFNFVLSLFKSDSQRHLILEEASSADDGLLEGLMELLIEVRQEARSRKDYASSDKIRDRLAELGLILEDTPKGARWKKQD
ncbi:MAG: cysteine--tRNA ligase [Clostridia bacterium]|nr:cysteine--tRNA ligase [Clostridia bacterium]